MFESVFIENAKRLSKAKITNYSQFLTPSQPPHIF